MELPSDEVTLQQTVLKMSPEKERSFELYTKEIVRHRGGSWVRNTEPLPEGWILINHHAGFPLYFHRETRVVTWSRTGFQSSRKFNLAKLKPIQALLCWQFFSKSAQNTGDCNSLLCIY